MMKKKKEREEEEKNDLLGHLKKIKPKNVEEEEKAKKVWHSLQVSAFSDEHPGWPLATVKMKTSLQEDG